jgi:hypothetical protein
MEKEFIENIRSLLTWQLHMTFLKEGESRHTIKVNI